MVILALHRDAELKLLDAPFEVMPPVPPGKSPYSCDNRGIDTCRSPREVKLHEAAVPHRSPSRHGGFPPRTDCIVGGYAARAPFHGAAFFYRCSIVGLIG